MCSSQLVQGATVLILRIAALAFISTLAPAAAWADDCAPVTAATLAGVSRPYAATIKMPGGDGLPVVSHVVMTGEKMYVEFRRSWISHIVTTKELVDKATKSALTSKLTCQLSGD